MIERCHNIVPAIGRNQLQVLCGAQRFEKPGVQGLLIIDVLKEKVRDEEVYWREAGLSEALIVYHVGNTGPWLVNMDTKGNVLYDRIYKKVDERVKEIYENLNISADFSFSSLEQ